MKQRLSGVYTAKRKDGTTYFRASLTYRNKHISLGSYDQEQEAHETYLCGLQLLRDSSCTLDDYDVSSPLSFSKWVSLINFRDNGIYMNTPIYIRPRFFYYYFSPSDFFIFDMDDLFYYASRKISRRGGHYFVADYGMQINIMSVTASKTTPWKTGTTALSTVTAMICAMKISRSSTVTTVSAPYRKRANSVIRSKSM